MSLKLIKIIQYINNNNNNNNNNNKILILKIYKTNFDKKLYQNKIKRLKYKI